MTHLAFLRGVNVGGKNRIKMAALRAALEAAGLTGVRSYIQSGNLVFDSRPGVDLATDCATVRAALCALGVDVPVVVRSRAALLAARAACPFPTEGVDPRFVHIGLCSEAPTAGAVAAMDPERGGIDRWTVVDDIVWTHTPKGMARTKLTSAWFDRSLGTVVTFRNLRTLDKVLALGA